jgi:putative restriction endonuclease
MKVVGMCCILLQHIPLIGWWEEAGVFAGFDFRKHLGLPGWSASIQIKEDALRSAYINGFAASDKGNEEIAIAFRPDFFVEYLRNLTSLHDFGQSLQDLQVLEDVVRDLEVNDEDISITDYERKSTAVIVKRKLRDIGFRKRVLTAYSYQCAICGIQLKLVDAAHIVPVQENGSDETSNGIALCALHHRAYDKGLVAVWDDYSIRLNNQQITKLRKANLDSGSDKFEENLRPIIHLPPSVSDRPHVENLKLANKIRGW